MTANAAVIDEIASHSYVQLTTFRRNGTAVPTPVWIARAGGQLAVISNDGVGKVKRLSGGGPVSLRPCDMRGRVADGAPTWTGTGRLTDGPAELKVVRDAINRKYVAARIGSVFQRLVGVVRPVAPRRGILITLD